MFWLLASPGGQSSLQVLKQLGTCACVDIADQKPAAVDADGARWITGDHYQNCLDDYDVVFKSPGIVLERPIESYRCAILSQAELFFHLFRDQIIGHHRAPRGKAPPPPCCTTC